MRFIQNVQGSEESSKSPIFNYDTVYIHTNVTKLPDNQYQTVMYQYDEYQYTRNEYLTIMAERQQIESELATALDVDLINLKKKQQIESDLITEHDINIFDLINTVRELKKEVEELKNGANKKRKNLS